MAIYLSVDKEIILIFPHPCHALFVIIEKAAKFEMGFNNVQTDLRISAGGWIDKSAALMFVVHTLLFLLYVRS